MADLAASGGEVKLHERQALAEEVGKPLSAIGTGLGVRIYRGERVIGFWEEGAQRLEAGDLIIEIVQGDGAARADAPG
jgi:voltage-gated potassium channel